jgi:hypothetical protein
MAAPTLQDLLTPRDQPTIESTLLASLQSAPIVGGVANSFPVTDWAPGSFERTTLKMIATGLVDRENVIPMLTAAGFLSLAQTITDADGNIVEGWMELLAQDFFNLPRGAATFAQQTCVLTCTTGPGPYTRNAGEIIAYSPSTGNRYSNLASVTVPDGDSLPATFQALSPGAGYNDAAGSIIGLITPMPGVSINNPVTAAGVPSSFLTGTGTIAVSSTGITSSPRTVQLTFTTAGRISDSSAQFTCTVYQGNTVTTTGPTVAHIAFAQGDLTLALTDGPTGTQSFNLGDKWFVGVPGTPLIQAGADKEPLAQLAQECTDRWPSLSDVPTVGRFKGWVLACSKAQGLGIVNVQCSPSTEVAGIENVWIAGAAATATPDQVAAEQAYLDVRVSDIEAANVIAATARSIALGGIVQCRRGTTAAVQKAADAGWLAYLAAMPIGGTPPDGLVELDGLIQVLMDAGAHNTSSLTLAGAAADVALAANEIATIPNDGQPSLSLTWQEIS